MTESLSDKHWLANKEGSTPASTLLHPEFLATVQGGKYLDVGCGFGRGAFELTKKGCTVVGVDINEKELREAKRKGNENVVFVNARGDALPFSNSTFDGAVMLGLLGGIVGEAAQETRRGIIADTVRTLRLGRPIFISEFARVTDPNAVNFYGQNWQQFYQDEKELTGELGSFTVRKPDGSTHFLAHHFTREELVTDLAQYGVDNFTVKEFVGRSALSGNPSSQIAVWGTKG